LAKAQPYEFQMIGRVYPIKKFNDIINKKGVYMHTYQIRVSDEIVGKFLWLLEYFKKDIEIVKVNTPNEFMRTMEASKKDIKDGNITSFNFDNFEKKLDE
jgi:hypothetical protein